ncbi:MAG: Minf_1886 family protein [Planctomycetota bacterium]
MRFRTLEEAAKMSGWHMEAYQFILESLQRTLKEQHAARGPKTRRKHITAQELLKGVVTHAADRFGYLAPTVFSQWGVRRSEDVGSMVFQMIDLKLLKKNRSDKQSDFDSAMDLQSALQEASQHAFDRVSDPNS